VSALELAVWKLGSWDAWELEVMELGSQKFAPLEPADLGQAWDMHVLGTLNMFRTGLLLLPVGGGRWKLGVKMIMHDDGAQSFCLLLDNFHEHPNNENIAF
jgi:hypothetical protein